MSPGEASLATGFSPSRISVLQGDPTFRELMAHYGEQRELAFVDVMERMKALGLTTMEEIQHRLEENPGEFTIGQLMDMTELMLVKGRAAPGSRQAGGGPGTGASLPAINIKFVTAAVPAGVVLPPQIKTDSVELEVEELDK